MLTRRQLLKSLALTGTAGIADLEGYARYFSTGLYNLKTIEIVAADLNFEREPLIRPFGFKGGFITELWQGVSLLQSASGIRKVGLSTQSILWSDAEVYATHSESGGNALMLAMTEFALQLVKGMSFQSPIELQRQILDQVYQYGVRISENPKLRKTFALNALVGLDNAAWMLYAAENGIADFDTMIPKAYRPALSTHHQQVAAIPLISYNTPVAEIEQLIRSGYFILKIKLGQPGTQSEMLQKDIDRVSVIHKAIGNIPTQDTAIGKPLYYFDANGRYEQKETLLKLVDHLKKIGAIDQVAIIEEPFPEEAAIRVDDIPVRIAADESAHTTQDVVERIQMGYRAIALKPIAKTLSMTLGMIQSAKAHGIPCFCADLTVNPILVDWNKNIAARLDPLPGLTSGLLESNGNQNYKNWTMMESYHPYPNASWSKVRKGVFNLNQSFYTTSGGVLSDSSHYMSMFRKRDA